jgi:pimeloyl-ACP methyl ester carboxylesterase
VKRLHSVLALLGALLFAISWIWISRVVPPERYEVLHAGGCHTPMAILEPLSGPSRGAVVLLHGLSANRVVMKTLGERLTGAGLRVYVLDLPGHGNSTDFYSFGRAETCATLTVEALVNRAEIYPDRMILVGHSMGGAVAVRMADRFPVAATIALSPAPMVLPRRMPSNLLVLSAQFELPILKTTALSLEQAAGGDREASADFAERRAFKLIRVPHSTHSSLIFDPSVAAVVTQWAGRSLPKDSLSPAGAAGSSALGGLALGFIGLLLLFPAAADLLVRVLHTGGAQTPKLPTRAGAGAILLRWAVAALFGVAILYYARPLWFLHLEAGDYLASLLLIAAIVALALDSKPAKAALHFEQQSLLMGILLGLATILVIGAWLNWQLTDDVWLNWPRWLRFAALFPVCWLYSLAEEATLGPPRDGPERVARFSLFLAMRFELWLACMLALFAFGKGEILLLLLVVYLAAFSVAQRLGGDSVHRRTGSATAAATFDAILACWFIAAVFPLA